MRLRLLSILPILLLFTIHWDLDESEPSVIMWQDTGIVLDTMGNEVKLGFLDGQPQYYFANIFTPVCNTGECLPVRINIYWDLSGRYLKFDQDEGEILTKLDHEPFTEDDYDLLDEILRGSDPRFAGQVKHSKMERGDESSPMPENVRTLSKYEMVDGITGSTLPEVKDKFVPGALYTTYTLWGLANDHTNKMFKYTQHNLLEPQYYQELLTTEQGKLDYLVIDHLAQLDGNQPDSRRKVLISLLDTGNVSIKKVALRNFYWDDIQQDDVQVALENAFDKARWPEVKKQVIYKWSYNKCPDHILLRFSEELAQYPGYMYELMNMFENKSTWPEGVFENLIAHYGKLDPDSNQMLKDMLIRRKDWLTKDQWKEVKKL